MPKDHSADLMKALVAKLYATVTGDDPSIKIPRNKYVSWFTPGLPFAPRDFLYCSKGMIGATAEATAEAYHQAFVLSKLFDYVPDVSHPFIDDKLMQTIMTSTQDSISSVYRDVLKYSKVVDMELTEKEQQKIKKYRDLMTITKQVEDIITEEMKEVTEPGPITVAYTTKMNDYLDAADEYMDLLIDAQSAKGSDPEAIRRVAEFANKSKFMRKRLEAAEMSWISTGYKNEFEQMNAYINQVTQRSMVLYKEDLLRKFEAARLTSPNDGASDFYYTTMLPGNFATSPGWTKFTFYSGDFETHYEKATQEWGASAGVNFGLFSIGAEASGSKVEIAQSQKATDFYASLEFTQVPICRPWFDPGFFSMRGWTLDELWSINYGAKKVSDGKPAPTGRLVAYPITALFVRNVNFKFAEADAQLKYINSQIKAGAKVGYGPFHVGGSYKHGNEQRHTAEHKEGGSISIEGMQLIGFINNLVPNSPDTNPALKPEQFV